MNKLIFTEWEGQILTALWTDGTITRLSLEEQESPSLLNRIYVGKVKNVVKNINAAFVEIQDGIIGYYSLTENREHFYTSHGLSSQIPKPGDEIVVQVAKDAVKTKAPVLTGKLSFPGKYLVLTMGKSGIGFSSKITDREWKSEIREMLETTIPDGCGLIVRTNAYPVSQETLSTELSLLYEKKQELLEKACCRISGSRLDEAPSSYLTAIRDLDSSSLGEIITDIPAIFQEAEDYLKAFQPEDTGKLRLYEDKLLPLSKLYSLEAVMETALRKQV